MLIKIDKNNARNIWIHAQKLDAVQAFGKGSAAVTKAVAHLGYVQIDTINVIERCHHHILFSRIPHYKRQHLQHAQTVSKSIFEYWTHALAYVPTQDYKYFVHQMSNINTLSGAWFSTVSQDDYQKVLRILKNGPVSIRDIKDDILVEKSHDWASKKPSKKALQLGFYKGDFVVCQRDGMLKKYDLSSRHFAWQQKPKAVSEQEYTNYLIDRALRAQGVVSLDSICHLDAKRKKITQEVLEKKTKKKQLVVVEIAGCEKIPHWACAETIEKKYKVSELTHILSPFDPLIIQRKRLNRIFDYNHIFEAYIPKEKRQFGYFTLPVLSENRIIALLDLKTERQKQKLLVNNWLWINKEKSKKNTILIEAELDRFEKFQLDN